MRRAGEGRSDGEGSSQVSQEFMCHSNLDIEPRTHWEHFGSNAAISGRLFTLSQGQQNIEFPDGFGIPILSTTPLNLATPNSHCPHCKAPVKAWQNIPVVSYLLLGGKCSNCTARISVRYPIIELVTGLMTLALAHPERSGIRLGYLCRGRLEVERDASRGTLAPVHSVTICHGKQNPL